MTREEEYIKVGLDIPQEKYDTMVAVLSGIGYYAFEETPTALFAFIDAADYSEVKFRQALDRYFPALYCSKTVERIPAKDWNAEWERNFQSVRVRDFCEVRPPFREPSPGVRHHVVIAPKMSFGTGHHATTWLMIEQCAGLDFEGRRVLDMGCGTGVLGILARKLGAGSVTCIDVDEWSYRNATENIELNEADGIGVIRGDAGSIPDTCYDIILANINRNVLIADRDRYIKALSDSGILVLSGIYNFDEKVLTTHYIDAGLALLTRREKDEWVSLSFKKD